MIGPLYDDAFHILKACHFLDTAPGHRFLISFLMCKGGESIHFARALSAISIFLTSWIVFKCFFRAKFEELSKTKKILLWTTIAFHPLIAFTFFYASQVTTSLTILWVSICSLLLLDEKKPKPTSILSLVSLAIVGPLIRFESILYLPIVIGACLLFRWLSQDLEIVPSLKKLLLKGLVFFSLFMTVSVTASFKLPHYRQFFDLSQHIPKFEVPQTAKTEVKKPKPLPKAASPKQAIPSKTSDTIKVIYAKAQPYPHDSYLATQVWASTLYAKALATPYSISFFGPWKDWWDIHQNKSLQQKLMIGATITLLFSAGLAVFLRIDSLKFFFAGTFVFLLSSLIISYVVRMDWYFVSRAYVPALASLPFFLRALGCFSKQLNLALVSAYITLSLACNYFSHYQSYEAFLDFEVKAVSKTSPQALLLAADNARAQGNFAKAQTLYKQAYRIVPESSLNLSRSSQKYWHNALVSLHFAARVNEDPETMAFAASKLMISDSTYATSICLQEPSIEIERCKTKQRLERFCRNVKRREFVPDFGFRYLRESPASLCGWDGG